MIWLDYFDGFRGPAAVSVGSACSGPSESPTGSVEDGVMEDGVCAPWLRMGAFISKYCCNHDCGC